MADIVFVMERVHRTRLYARFASALDKRKLIVLNIPDRYDFMDPELVRILESKVSAHLKR